MRRSQARSGGAAATVVLSVLVTVLGVVAAGLGPPVGAAPGAPCLRPPVVGEVTDPFRAPSCPWCAGNRGIEYRVAPGTAVVSAAAGRVEFAGAVAGTTYVVVRLASGWRLTYGRLTSLTVAAGEAVLAGRVLGRVDDALFFGLRIGEEYADPAPFLGRVVGRPRLVPVDGSAGRAVPPQVTCRVDARPR